MQRICLRVPFSEKDEAKKLGARWDAKRKVWYVPRGFDPDIFKKWEQTAIDSPEDEIQDTTLPGAKRGFIRRYDKKCGYCAQVGVDVYLNLWARNSDGRRYIACPTCGKVFTPPSE